MKKEWVFKQNDFDKMLIWLDPDRETAGEKYEAIRRGLIDIFTYRGCAGAEDLADETINRVAQKLNDISETYVGDPARYFYAVAKKIHMEYLRRKPALPLTPDIALAAEPPGSVEWQYECLDECMSQLTPTNREMVLLYYKKDKQAKIDSRKELGRRLNLTSNTLRVRLHRIRETLEQCVLRCVEQKEAARNRLD